MRKGMVGFFMVLCCGALLASGCAKKEMMKGEEGISPPSTAKPAEQIPAKPSVKEEVVQEQPIKEAPASVKEETMKSAKAGESALERIYFDFDSFVLTQPSRDTLYKDAEWLLKNNPVKVQIEGHCDERGSDEYNLALGEKRAKAAMNYLVTLGVLADRLSIISYGKEKPLDPGHDEAAWAKNRRAEFVIISK
ncbi:MAG: peptidoglycan-associated [Geobacteraceae bacterium]|nr:MAG: peptidoglycan-associated [Geobacteraceae bacterium]